MSPARCGTSSLAFEEAHGGDREFLLALEAIGIKALRLDLVTFGVSRFGDGPWGYGRVEASRACAVGVTISCQ